MNSLKILNHKEKKEILEKLNKQFGISKLNGILLQKGTERIFFYQGSLTEKQILELEKSRIGLERVGIYFAKEIGNQIRLSIDAIHILKNQITKNIFKLNKEQSEQWIKGNELNIQLNKKEFLIIKYKNDFLGCGKASEKKITNFIPKNRRLKK